MFEGPTDAHSNPARRCAWDFARKRYLVPCPLAHYRERSVRSVLAHRKKVVGSVVGNNIPVVGLRDEAITTPTRGELAVEIRRTGEDLVTWVDAEQYTTELDEKHERKARMCSEGAAACGGSRQMTGLKAGT